MEGEGYPFAALAQELTPIGYQHIGLIQRPLCTLVIRHFVQIMLAGKVYGLEREINGSRDKRKPVEALPLRCRKLIRIFVGAYSIVRMRISIGIIVSILVLKVRLRIIHRTVDADFIALMKIFGLIKRILPLAHYGPEMHTRILALRHRHLFGRGASPEQQEPYRYDIFQFIHNPYHLYCYMPPGVTSSHPPSTGLSSIQVATLTSRELSPGSGHCLTLALITTCVPRTNDSRLGSLADTDTGF